MRRDFIDIVFDGPPGPEAGRFVEVEDAHGHGMKFGEWVKRQDGYWVLRIRPEDMPDFDEQPANEFVHDDGPFGMGA